MYLLKRTPFYNTKANTKSIEANKIYIYIYANSFIVVKYDNNFVLFTIIIINEE